MRPCSAREPAGNRPHPWAARSRAAGEPASSRAGSVPISWVQGDTDMEDESDLTGATPRRRPKPAVLEIGGRKLKPSTLMMGHGYRSGPVRRLAEAADLPHLDLRLRECGGRQAPLRRRHRQAPGRRRGPGLFALQRPQSGDPRRPARPVGRRRGRAQLLLRHVGDRDPAARLRPARRRRSSIRARSTPRPRP